MVAGITTSEEYFLESLVTLVWLTLCLGTSYGEFKLRDHVYKVPSRIGRPFKEESDNIRDYKKRRRQRDFKAFKESFGLAIFWYLLSIPMTLMVMFDYAENVDIMFALLKQKWGVFAWMALNMTGDWFFRRGLIGD